jgi:hypothetical protein
VNPEYQAKSTLEGLFESFLSLLKELKNGGVT